MTNNGGRLIAEILKGHGVHCIFTLSGGHISPILVGCNQVDIRVVDVRHEVNAVFAADALARLTGAPGVAVVTAGPGVTNTITALKNAQMAQSGIVLLGGAAATLAKGRGSLQDIDQISLVKSVVKMAVTVNRNCDIGPVLEHAFEVAGSGVPGPVFVEFPIDLLYSEKLVREWYGFKAREVSPGRLKSKLFQFYLNHHMDKMFACDLDTVRTIPRKPTMPKLKKENTSAALAMLAKAKRPVMIVGSQALLNPAESGKLAAAIEHLGLPVFLTGMARGLMGKAHPLQMRHKRKEALKKADLVLIAGMPCDFRLDYGRAIPAKAKLVAANRSKPDLALNRKPDLAVHADPALFLQSLADTAGAKINRNEWINILRSADDQREAAITAMDASASHSVNPLSLLRQLDDFLGEDSILVADGGDFVATAAYVLRPRKPLSWLDPGAFGTLGVGAGFALGAKLSQNNAEVWLLYGDGAAGYSLQEFDTFVRHGLPVIAVVGNDASWAQIARDQIELFGDDVATVLRHTDYHQVAEGYGAKGILVTQESEIPSALLAAREHARKGLPVLLNVHLAKTDFRKGSISM